MIEHLIFGILALGAISFLSFKVAQKWRLMHEVGTGATELSISFNWLRLKGVLVDGLLQPKMFRDIPAGLMHFFIFWGFIIVSIGTVETLITGIFPGLSFESFLGNGFIFKLHLSLQDFGNAAVAAAILFAILRRLFFSPPRLRSLPSASKTDAFIVLGFILVLVTTSLLILGLKGFSQAIPLEYIPFSALLTRVLAIDNLAGGPAEGIMFWRTPQLSLDS